MVADDRPISYRPPEGLHLYYHPRCPYSQRTLIVLAFGKVEHEKHPISLMEPPEGYKELVSPNGTVPAIVHHGKNIWESNVVNEYLDEVFELGLVPNDPVKRARMRILMGVADGDWMPTHHGLKRLMSGEDEGTEDDHDRMRHDVRDFLRLLNDRFAADGPWLLGKEMSLADVAFMTTIPHLDELGVEVPPGLIRIRRWLEAVESVDAYVRVPTANSAALEVHKMRV